MTDFERFIHERGWEFKTDEALKAAYDRNWKCRHDILITQDEFITEANKPTKRTVAEVYDALVALVMSGKLKASDVYRYARYKWCLDDAAAIVAYQVGHNKWEVNNCGTKTTEEAAKINVCEEFGFEASRIRIIGTPYYDATDYNFIRFNCGAWAWLMRNGEIYQVYQ